MISLEQYVGPHKSSPNWTDERRQNAIDLLDHVNRLLSKAIGENVVIEINPVTKSNVSGVIFGGFRPQSCPQGTPHSSHKEGQGVDVYDPHNFLDDWITDEILEEFGLYREHPNSTPHWCHLTTRAPGSGHRTFLP